MRNMAESGGHLRWALVGLAVCAAAAVTLWLAWTVAAYDFDPGSNQVIGHTLAGTEASPWAPVEKERLDGARRLLARRLDVPGESLMFVSEQAVYWPDTSLGCGEPGKVYARVIVPGFRIAFAHDGGNYEVHAAEKIRVGNSLAPVSCERGIAYPR